MNKEKFNNQNDNLDEKEKNISQEYIIGANVNSDANDTSFYANKSQEMWQKELDNLDENDSRRANIHRKLGEDEKANELYSKKADDFKKEGESYSLAAEAYEEACNEEAAKEMWLKQAEKYKAKGRKDQWTAAIAYEKLGDEEAAKEMWQKGAYWVINNQGNLWWNRAAEVFDEIGQHRQAGDVLVAKADDQIARVKTRKSMGRSTGAELDTDEIKELLTKATIYYEKAGGSPENLIDRLDKMIIDLSQKARIHDAKGEASEAQDLWIRIAETNASEMHYDKAADAYEKADDEEKAKEMWKLEGINQEEVNQDSVKARLAYRKAGETSKEEEMMILVAKDLKKKAEEAESNENYEEAAKIYEEIDSLGDVDAELGIKDKLKGLLERIKKGEFNNK